MLCALVAGFVVAHAAWAQPAGRVDATHRLVWLQKPDGTVNPVAEGASFETGDTISTGRASSARLVFADGGEIMLRPDSQLRIERYGYQVETPQADNAFFRLLKGGMRAVTGLIGKRGNRDAYRVGALTATIGVRGTDYTTRICGDDCAEESRKIPPTDRTPVQIPAARLVSAQGRVIAINAKGVARDLEQKSAVYQGDTVRTAPGGYAILVFRDEGRMTLAADTAFTVEQFRYQQVRPEQNSVVFRLLQGGLRSITGLVAKRRPDAYRINTVTATIGVRGTEFGIDIDWSNTSVEELLQLVLMQGAALESEITRDLLKQMAAANEEKEALRQKASDGKTRSGLLVHTWDGSVLLDTPAGRFELSKDKTAVIVSPDGRPVFLPGVPSLFNDNRLPPPDKIDVDMKDLFVTTPDKYDPGLYVYVRDGKVQLTDGGKEVIIDPGEGGYVDGKGGPPRKIDAPLALKYDPWLQPTRNICR